MTAEQKKWIDDASYLALLKRWRFAEAGDPIFTGDTGPYYAEVMAKKKEAIGRENAVATSKQIGWERKK